MFGFADLFCTWLLTWVSLHDLGSFGCLIFDWWIICVFGGGCCLKGLQLSCLGLVIVLVLDVCFPCLIVLILLDWFVLKFADLMVVFMLVVCVLHLLFSGFPFIVFGFDCFEFILFVCLCDIVVNLWISYSLT